MCLHSFSHPANLQLVSFQSLQHVHILPCWGYYQDPTHVSLVLDYCPDGDLLSHMLQWRSTAAQRLERCRLCVRQLASALAYLHTLQVAHRDLKPENMVVLKKEMTATTTDAATDADLVLQLCDFGWAVWWQPGHYNRTLCGTAEYVPPEMLHKTSDGRSYAAECVDAWALGIFAVEFVQGASPFSLANDDSSEDQEVLSDVHQQALIFEKIRCFTGIHKDVVQKGNDSEDWAAYWDLVSALCQAQPEHRLTAEQASQHAFLQPQGEATMSTSPRSTMDIPYQQKQQQPPVAQHCQTFQLKQLQSSVRE